MSSVLLDTGFLIRLVTPDESLHKNSVEYFNHFLRNKIIMRVSTIAVAEFCVKGSFEELPLSKILILPFNINHAITAGEMHKACNVKQIRKETETKRDVIINDIKMFAQAHQEIGIDYFVTADSSAIKYYNKIKEETPLSFDFVDISKPLSEYTRTLF